MPISGSKAVVFGFDENYAPAGLLSMFSMFINSRSRDYEVYILTDSLSSSTVSKIDHIGRIFSRKIVIKRVPLDNIKNTFPVSGHISAAAYFRLYAPELIDSDQIIWIDSDTIIHCEIDDIFKEGDKGFVVYGVGDPIVQLPCNKRLEINHNEIYINSGVMLIDRNNWNNFDTLRKCADFAINKEKIRYWDQCIINKILVGRKGVLPSVFNTMQHSFDYGQYNGKDLSIANFRGIIHYTTEIKPWHSWCNRGLIHFYKAYSQIAPYRMADVYVPEDDFGKERLRYWLSREGW